MGEYSGKSGKTVCNNSPTPHNRFGGVIVSAYDRNVYKKWVFIHIVDYLSVSECIEILKTWLFRNLDQK